MIYSKSINFKVTYTFKESHLLLDCLTPSSSKLIRSFRLSISLSGGAGSKPFVQY